MSEKRWALYVDPRISCDQELINLFRASSLSGTIIPTGAGAGLPELVLVHGDLAISGHKEIQNFLESRERKTKFYTNKTRCIHRITPKDLSRGLDPEDVALACKNDPKCPRRKKKSKPRRILVEPAGKPSVPVRKIKDAVRKHG